jgi:hypothetical protein
MWYVQKEKIELKTTLDSRLFVLFLRKRSIMIIAEN